MKWNDRNGYIIYKTSLQSIESMLGISQIDYSFRCELVPYITYILNYISNRLILIPEDSDILVYINEFLDIKNHGEEKILFQAVDELRLELNIDNGEIYVDNSEIPYNEDRFIYSWSNVVTAIWVRLKFQYQHLLTQQVETDCPCGNECTPGQTFKDFESWSSKVYPEDEEFSHFNYNGKTSTDWRVGNNAPECTKCLRNL